MVLCLFDFWLTECTNKRILFKLVVWFNWLKLLQGLEKEGVWMWSVLLVTPSTQFYLLGVLVLYSDFGENQTNTAP